MEWITVVEIISAALGLIGIFCLGKYVSDTFFLPREMVTAVTILDDVSRKNADLLLHTLQKGIWRWANRRVLVIVSERYSDDAELMKMIDDFGAECVTVIEK